MDVGEWSGPCIVLNQLHLEYMLNNDHLRNMVIIHAFPLLFCMLKGIDGRSHPSMIGTGHR
jgi:hypothetical protein